MKERLLSANEAARADAAAEVEASPERFNPEIFHLVSQVHLAEDRPQDAMFWFLRGDTGDRVSFG